jgi:hypothetical protein
MSTPDYVEPATLVPLLLSAAGLAPPSEEVAKLVGAFPAIRATVDSLYAVPGLADTAPVLAFSPTAPTNL